MGSAESFGGAVAVKEVGRHTGVASSSGVFKETQVADVSTTVSWDKMSDSELRSQCFVSPSFHDDDVKNDVSIYTKSSSRALDPGVKFVLGKTGKIPKSNSLCAKRLGITLVEVSRSKSGLPDAAELSPALSSYSANRDISEKIHTTKQRNLTSGKRGDKRNGKVHKNRCDSISLKNGLVSFNSAASGNNFFGIYGLKSNVFDIKKFVDEIPLNELLNGKYHRPCLNKDKGKKVLDSNGSLLQSVRRAFTVLQSRKVLQAENYADIDHSCARNASSSLGTSCSTVNQIDGVNEDYFVPDVSSSDQVQDYVGNSNRSQNSNTALHQPKEILMRLALSPQRDLDSLLLDAGKPPLKNSSDPRLVKSISHRAGLPPFPWSHSFSGHNKLGIEAVKLSTSRTMCHGRWINITNCIALQNCSSTESVDLESITFDNSLVPSENFKVEHPEKDISATALLLSSSDECLASNVPEDEHSPAYAAAEALCEMAHSMKRKSNVTVHLLNDKPSQIIMKACKLKAVEKSGKIFTPPKSKSESPNFIKVGNDGFPSKKLKLSTDVRNSLINHTDNLRKGLLNWPTHQPVRSKGYGETKVDINSYNINLVRKSYMMKPPRAAERPGISHQRLRKIVPGKWSRPEG